MQEDQRLAVSVATAASMLSLGKTSIYRALADGSLQRCAIYKRTLITTESIRRLVETSTVVKGAE